MRGSSQYEAIQAHTKLLSASLACVIAAPQVRAGALDREGPFGLALNSGRNVPLTATVPHIALRLHQWFRLVNSPEAVRDERWRVSITSYDYALLNPDTEAELLAFHWHPELAEGGMQLVTFPHLHIDSSVLSEPALTKMHIPTERIAVEDVVGLVIRDFKARPLVRNWERRLRSNRVIVQR